MLTHHLTIIQHKHLFLSDPGDCVWIRDGYNPADAYRYGLHPVTAITLSVEGLDIHYQELFQSSGMIDIHMFLYHAWTNVDRLGGMPQLLCIDRELKDEYPIVQLLNCFEQQPYKVQISWPEDEAFYSAKQYAHVHAWHGHNWEQLTLPPYPIDQFKALELLEEHANKQCWKNLLEQSRVDSVINRKLLDHFKHPIILPKSEPQSFHSHFFSGNWISRSANSIPLMTDRQSLKVIKHYPWINILDLVADSTHKQIPNFMQTMPPEELYTSRDVPGIAAILRSLPNYEENGQSVDVLPNLKGFLSGRDGLTEFELKSLVDEFKATSLILFPKSFKALADSIDYLTYGGSIRFLHELTSEGPGVRFRIIACDSVKQGLFLTVVVVGSKPDTQKLDDYIDQHDGGLDIGHAGYSALHYWLENLIIDQPKSNSRIFLEMVKHMLTAFMSQHHIH